MPGGVPPGMPRLPQAIRTTHQGVEIWVSPYVPEITALCNGFHGTAYERAATTVLSDLDAPLDRIEVHPGVLVLVFQRHLNVACQAVGVPLRSQPTPDESPTIWERITV